METKASYVMVGAFALALVLGTLGFVIWLAQSQTDAPRLRYDMIFDGSVTGLREGAPVRLNGVKVGDVVLIALDAKDPSKVRIGLDIFEGTPIKEDTRASLEMEGLTGGRYILLTGGKPTAGPLAMTEGEEHPIITSTKSSFEEILAGAPDVIANINLLLERAQALLSEDNVALLSETFRNTRDFTQLLADSRGRVENILADVETLAESVKNTTDSIEGVVTLLEKDGTGLIANANQTLVDISGAARTLNDTLLAAGDDLERLMAAATNGATSFSEMSQEIDGLVAENREAIRDFASTGLLELAAFLSEARELVVALQAITTNVERDPARFLFGDQTDGYAPE